MLDVFSLAGESAKTFVHEFSRLSSIVDSLSASNTKKQVHALRLSGLSELAQSHGTDSEVYLTAKSALNVVLTRLFASPTLRTAYLHIPPSSDSNHQKRGIETSLLSPFHIRAPSTNHPSRDKKKRAPEDKPIVSSSKRCYASQTACEDETYNCNGRGGCVVGASLSTLQPGEECWVCKCGRTEEGSGNGKRTSYWAGEMCEKEDYSNDFLLLFGSSLALIVVVTLSIKLLASVGDGELPSVLSSVSGGHSSTKRD
ncbi:hypothetical protein BT69DRAFT_1221967 [Atractiella rhizophila]|nr:hypothetical protein BT69DRAFT_1221967 [Atractiella rhizophila]